MADKDVGRGWGDLNGSLTEWHCPRCVLNYSVADWQIILKSINGNQCEGRKCPKCEFDVYMAGETTAMDPFERTFTDSGVALVAKAVGVIDAIVPNATAGTSGSAQP